MLSNVAEYKESRQCVVLCQKIEQPLGARNEAVRPAFCDGTFATIGECSNDLAKSVDARARVLLTASVIELDQSLSGKKKHGAAATLVRCPLPRLSAAPKTLS
jgi:hypothetical protein